jgi:hypothetical protein
MRSVQFPMISAVTAASSATGVSLVPAANLFQQFLYTFDLHCFTLAD